MNETIKKLLKNFNEKIKLKEKMYSEQDNEIKKNIKINNHSYLKLDTRFLNYLINLLNDFKMKLKFKNN